jgi:hypothetical protein
MANGVLKKLSEKLNKEKGNEPFSLAPEERDAVSQTLNAFLDLRMADHGSSHQNNHSSRP